MALGSALRRSACLPVSQRHLAPVAWTVGWANSASAILFPTQYPALRQHLRTRLANRCIALGGTVEFEGRRNGHEANETRAQRATRCWKFSSFRHRDGLCWDRCGSRATFIYGFESDRQSPAD